MVVSPSSACPVTTLMLYYYCGTNQAGHLILLLAEFMDVRWVHMVS
jgi:hypothetical protein